MHRNLPIFFGIVILVVINFLIMQKEEHLVNGERVLLELAPVDPRSLMQGDYMRLDFAIKDDIHSAWKEENKTVPSPHDGFVIVERDQDNVATFLRLSQVSNHDQGEIALQYRVRHDRIQFGTNAFFFQEGDAKVFEESKYGHFRVNEDGELLLTSMYDAQKAHLGGDQYPR